VIDTISGRATAGSLAIDAEYKLFSMGNDKPIVSGLAFVVASYDRTNQRFANIRAARDAELRDAKALAEQIKTRLIADLSKTE
jgi:LPS-assembly lipoprotein